MFNFYLKLKCIFSLQIQVKKHTARSSNFGMIIKRINKLLFNFKISIIYFVLIIFCFNNVYDKLKLSIYKSSQFSPSQNMSNYNFNIFILLILKHVFTEM